MTLNGSMDSLLKEIDDEMVNTENSEWKLPSQNISDETMKMLENHDTKENSYLQGNNDRNNRSIRGSETLPYKKTVGFSEGVQLHEYAKAPEEPVSWPEQYSQDLNTAWKQSRPKQQLLPKQPLPALPPKEESEDEREEEGDPDLEVDELRIHGIKNTSDKLSNVLDSNRNIYQLKQMAQSVDTRATQIGLESNERKLSLALEPTQHLLADEESSNDSGNEEDEEDEYGESESPCIAQSPSKIPLTNTISINNYSLENMKGNSRVSSGSSYAGSASELETTTKSDKSKLLDYNSQIPTELQYKQSEGDSFSFSPPKFTKHPNSSNAFSFTTEYESARETSNDSTSDLASEIREASVENLGIPTGIREPSPVREQEYSIESSEHDDTLREEDYKSPNVTANESNHSQTFDDNDKESKNNIEYADLHEISSSYDSESEAEESSEPQAECSKLTENLNESIASRHGSRISSNGSNIFEESNKPKTEGLERLPSLKTKSPALPALIPTVETGPIFNQDPFEEIFDSSGESLDLTRSVKPSDYISIWHSQADDLRSHSPTISSNSQFSQRSFSSQSSNTSVHRNEFRFKSRLVTRCRYYNPENRILVPSDSEEDDDMIYAVDHALDPKSRNTLITKQLRNSVRQNKRLNPLRLAALGLQAQGVVKQEDDEDSPYDSYPVTLAPITNTVEDSKELIPEVKEEEDAVIRLRRLRNEPGPVPREASDVFEFQSYEHLAAFANTPEVSRVEVPNSPLTDRDQSIAHTVQSGRTDTLPIMFPNQVERTPVTIPPRNANRQASVPILTPPPRNINRMTGSPPSAQAPSFYHMTMSPLASTGHREENYADAKSFTNEFESPPAPLSKKSPTYDFSNNSHQQQEIDELLLKNPEELELCPSLPERGLGDELGHYFETLSPDDHSLEQSIRTRQGGYNLWSPEFDLTENGNRKSSMPSEVLNKLLESENGTEDMETNHSRNSESSQGYIRTPIDDVFIGRGLSVNGLEAIVSNEEASERNSVLFDEFHDGNLYHTPNHSPMGKMHVKSPFKPVSPNKSPNRQQEKTEDIRSKQKQDQILPVEQTENTTKFNPRSDSLPNLEPDSKLEHLSKDVANPSFTEEKDEEITEDISSKKPQHISIADKTQDSISKKVAVHEESKAPSRARFPDAGNLYLKLRGIFGIMLSGVSRRKAQFAIEFDNGKNIAQTPWQPMEDDGRINIDREFEAVLDADSNNQRKIILTLKCRYERIIYEPQVQEIIEKVPIMSKRKLFGKRKEQYEYQKRLIKKPAKEDEWDFIFARDGSFGRCELVLDGDFLDHAKFQIKPINLDLKNEWARHQGPPGMKPHQLPRKAPYILGQLKLDACYLARSSPLEKFPKSLVIARGIMSKYRSQQGISKEGYLMQQGGDLGKDTIRRYFKLQGNTLIGYHEVTRKAKIIINLLKVSNVIGPTGIQNNENSGSQSCFHLIFANEETITFDTEFSTDEKYDWYRNIKHVVDLNKSHQPWVKAFYENAIINSV